MTESKTKVRIAQLIDSLDPGGAERMAINLANEFSERGIDHRLWISRHDGGLSPLVYEKHRLHFLNKKSTFDWRAFQNLLIQVDSFRPDLIHAHGTSVYWSIALKWFRPTLKLIWHDHLGISNEVITSNPRRELDWLARWIDFIVTANQSTEEYWKTREIITKEKIQYLPNFPHLFPIDKKENQTFTFLHLANYRPEKGQLLLLEAAGLMVKKGLVFKLRMVGKAVDHKWKTKILQVRSDLGLDSIVQLDGEVQDIAPVLADANAGLVASDREGLPVAILEYGLASLPVISTAVGQCPQVLGFGQFGVLVPPGNPDLFAIEMEKMLSNRNKSSELGNLFQDHVKSHYGSDHFFSPYLSILKLLLPTQLPSD